MSSVKGISIQDQNNEEIWECLIIEYSGIRTKRGLKVIKGHIFFRQNAFFKGDSAFINFFRIPYPRSPACAILNKASKYKQMHS